GLYHDWNRNATRLGQFHVEFPRQQRLSDDYGAEVPISFTQFKNATGKEFRVGADAPCLTAFRCHIDSINNATHQVGLTLSIDPGARAPAANVSSLLGGTFWYEPGRIPN